MRNPKILAAVSLAAMLLIPVFAFAQPGGSPPSGNVDANFNSVRIDGDLTFFNPALGWPFANFTIFSSGDMRDDDGNVRVTDTQGFSVLDDSGANEWLRIGSNGIISNPSTANSGKVLLYDPEGVQLSPYFEVGADGIVQNTDSVQNGGWVAFGDSVDITGQLDVATTSGYGIRGATTQAGYFAGDFIGNTWGLRSTATNGTAGDFTGTSYGISVEATGSGGTGVSTEAPNHGIYSRGTGVNGIGGTFRTANNMAIVASNDTYGSVINAATPTNGLSVGAPTGGGGRSITAINIGEGSEAIIADDSYGVYAEAPTSSGPSGQYGVYSDGKTGTGGYFEGDAAGGYFKDTNSTGYAYIGYGMRGVQAYGSNGSYFYNVNTGSNGEVGALQSGIEAYGNTQGGYFADLTESGYARLGTGDYGIMGYGNTMGGYFQDRNNTSTYANIANGSYGLMGYGGYGVYGGGTSIGGYFNDTNSSGYAYVGYGDAGIYARGGSYGGYFSDSNSSGYAYLAYGDRGIDATGSYTGGTFRNTSGVWADLASSSYSLITSSSIAMNGGQAYKPGGGSWASSSDIRLKDVKGEYNRGLDEILQLDPVEFRYKEDNALDLPSDEDYVGFVAQDVQKVIPEAISQGEKGYLFLDMHPLNVAVINAIKELATMVDTEVADLRSELAQQQREIDELKDIVCELKPEHVNCH